MTTTTQGASAELLPCPFCKSEVSNSGKLMHEIDCYIMRPSEAAWNRRAAQPAAPVVPEGYVLVPKEPTNEQWRAGIDEWNSVHGTPAGEDELPNTLYRAMIAAAPQVVPQAEQVAKAAYGPVHVVGDLVRNLLTLDQSAPIYAAFHVDFDGRRRCRTRPVMTSWERVVAGKWVESSRIDAPYSVVVWAKPQPGEAVATPERAAAPEHEKK